MGLIAKGKIIARQFPFVFPRKIIYSCEDWIMSQRNHRGVYFSQRGPWYKTISPEGFLQNEKPKTLGLQNEKAFYNYTNYPTEKATLFYLQNSYVFGHKGMVLTKDHCVFQEFSHHFNVYTLKKFLRKTPFYTFSTNIKKLVGVGAVLVSPESQNYYHWLSDVLPRIKMYEPVLEQIDYFCISSRTPAKFLDILPDFGIPKEKILLIQEKEKLHFDHLYVASLPGSEGRSPEWAVDYVREKMIRTSTPVSPYKKIYLKRPTNTVRKIVNEDSVITTLLKMGFEIIEPDNLSIHDQVAIMQQAKIVISAHGAALSNLLFSQDKTTVIEVFTPDYFRTDCFYTLSSIRKLDYWYIIGDKPPDTNWGDVVLNEELLIRTIEASKN